MRWNPKGSKCSKACEAEGITFIPLVVEALGAWEEGATQVVKKIGQALARATGQDDNEVVGHLFGKLSILLQRDNASLILNRAPDHPAPSLTGDL